MNSSHSHELLRKQIYTGTVRSIKRKNFKQNFNGSGSSSGESINDSGSGGGGGSDLSLNKLNQIVTNRTRDEFIFGGGRIGGINNHSSVVLTKMSLLWNSSGWIRVYCGPDRSDLTCDDPSRMVHVLSNSNTTDVIRDMDLPTEYTIWLQIGGATSRRLLEYEHPFMIQEEFLKKLGYLDESRRARLGIDPELKHLLRFHIGPTEIEMCRGVTKSGTVEILKGLVFPQWRRRAVTLIGSRLLVFPGNNNLTPEIFDLSGADIFEHLPNYNRLILKIIPKISCGGNSDSVFSNNNNNNSTTINNNNNSISVYNSNVSVNSSVLGSGGGSGEKVLFFGFEESWERDLWSTWLLEVSLNFLNRKNI